MSQSTKQFPKRQPCLAPLRSFHVCMVHLDTPERIAYQHFEEKFGLATTFLHAGTGEKHSDKTYHLEGPQTLYFAASDKEVLADWFYILQWSHRLQRYCCSCRENREYAHCGHAEELAEVATASPEKIVAVA